MRLPVEDIRAQLVAALAGEEGRVLLRAPTGSGKSTQVPGMLLDGLGPGRILVVQPRRIAARLLAEFVARQRGGKVGGEVGYAVRFDSKYMDETRVIYLTDGVLQRWLKEEPGLPGVRAVIFDEFHERRLASDIALARVLGLQKGARPDLRVVVMSATLETAGLRDYLEPCVELETGGRLFPVEIENRSPPPPKRGRHGHMETMPVWEQVGRILRTELIELEGGEGNPGTPPRVLVFLPGAFEIRKTVEHIERSSWSRGWEVKPLYSALPPQRQWAAVGSGDLPRVIVSTNVAETSITIEGVALVVDSGLARMASYDTRRGIDTLTIRKISRASAEQRAGRAGRTGPGRCVRLWSAADHAGRIEFELPEVRRVDLADAILYLLASGTVDVRGFPWLDAPAEDALHRAEDVLEKLGATEGGAITALGATLARFPLHPRQAALLVAAAEEDCVEEACFAAAILQAEGVFARGASRAQRNRFQGEGDLSDFEAEWRAWEAAESCGFDPGPCAPLGIHARQAREVQRVWRQLCGLAQGEGLLGGRDGKVNMEARREGLARALLKSYRDHIGVRLGEGTLACRVRGGRRGKLDEASVAREGRIFVAAEMTEVEGRDVIVQLSRCVRIEEEWLRDSFPDAFHEEAGAMFDDVSRRVMGRRRVMFDDLVLDDREGGEVRDEEAARLLATEVHSGKLKLKKWDGKVEQWISRVNFLAAARPELGIPRVGDDERCFLIEQVVAGARSYREIKERDVWPALREWLSPLQAAALESCAPQRLKLPNGREARVRYQDGAPPKIGLKVQQLYGVDATPEIAGVPLQVEVLAPNDRPWQVTQDLASFWESGYPQMRKDLAGRYPKHEWR